MDNIVAFCEEFLSTPSARRATSRYTASMPVRMDFYPRPPRGGRQQPWTVTLDDGTISIHALREEGDRAALLGAGVSVSISIHALREEGDRSRRRPLQSQRRISIHALREEGDER